MMTIKETTKGQDLPIPSIGFLMGVTYRKLSALLQQRLKEYEITPEQWSVLYAIDRSQGLIQKEIAERTYKDKPTTTRILDHLESKGLIFKKVGERDRRSFVVYSTDRGRELIQHTIPIEESITETVQTIVPERELEQLKNTLLRINAQIGELLEH